MRLEKGDALIIVNVQRDFLPGGSLGVPDDGDNALTEMRRLGASFIEVWDLNVTA